MSDYLKTIRYFRSQFYNEYPQTFVGTGNGTVYSAKELKDFKPKENGGGGGDTPSDGYSKAEIDAIVAKLATKDDLSKQVCDVQVNTDGDEDYIKIERKGSTAVIDIDRADSDDIDNLIKVCEAPVS